MDIAIFTELIVSVGFPIAAVIALCCFIWTIYKRSEKREDELRAEIKGNQEIIAQSMTILAQYADRLDAIQADVKQIKDDVLLLTNK